jgi:hypothetical protein
MAFRRDDPEVFKALMAAAEIPDNVGNAVLRTYQTASHINFAIRTQRSCEMWIWNLTDVEDGGPLAADHGIVDRNFEHHPVVGSLRRLWHDCWQACEQATEAGPARGELELGVYAPPPKLDDRVKTRLRLDFDGNYPGELLTASNTPGSILWSTVAAMRKPDGPTKYTWIPWPQILCQSRENELLREKSRRPRSDAALLATAVWVDLLENDERDTESLLGLLQMQETRRNAFALCQHCHLASKKLVDDRFNRETQKKAAKGMRKPNHAERCEAGQVLWTAIFELCNEQGWKLDEACYEYAVNRHVPPASPRLHPGSAPPRQGRRQGRSQAP